MSGYGWGGTMNNSEHTFWRVDQEILEAVDAAGADTFENVYDELMFGDSPRNYETQTIAYRWELLRTRGFLKETTDGQFTLTEQARQLPL